MSKDLHAGGGKRTMIFQFLRELGQNEDLLHCDQVIRDTSRASGLDRKVGAHPVKLLPEQLQSVLALVQRDLQESIFRMVGATPQ